jgi:hypothetical protein
MTPQKFKQTEIGKIPEDWEECKQRKNHFYFNFNGKKKKIRFIENPKKQLISSGGIHGISVGKLFFEKFNEKERVAILWHEFYHCRYRGFPVLFKIMLAEDFHNIKPKFNEEFIADEYSAIKNNFEDCLSMLKTCKTLYDEFIIKRDEKLHPPIEERIKRIEKLK